MVNKFSGKYKLVEKFRNLRNFIITLNNGNLGIFVNTARLHSDQLSECSTFNNFMYGFIGNSPYEMVTLKN